MVTIAESPYANLDVAEYVRPPNDVIAAWLGPNVIKNGGGFWGLHGIGAGKKLRYEIFDTFIDRPEDNEARESLRSKAVRLARYMDKREALRQIDFDTGRRIDYKERRLNRGLNLIVTPTDARAAFVEIMAWFEAAVKELYITLGEPKSSSITRGNQLLKANRDKAEALFKTIDSIARFLTYIPEDCRKADMIVNAYYERKHDFNNDQEAYNSDKVVSLYDDMLSKIYTIFRLQYPQRETPPARQPRFNIDVPGLISLVLTHPSFVPSARTQGSHPSNRAMVRNAKAN